MENFNWNSNSDERADDISPLALSILHAVANDINDDNHDNVDSATNQTRGGKIETKNKVIIGDINITINTINVIEKGNVITQHEKAMKRRREKVLKRGKVTKRRRTTQRRKRRNPEN
jgi:hypothetical protein